MQIDNRVHLLGIRHHGPGSAHSVQKALEMIQPEVILIEGPMEGETLLPLANHANMVPPVALMVYAKNDLSLCSFFPFAEFSPEWQAIQFGLKNNCPIQLFDLPHTHSLALKKENNASDEQEVVDPQRPSDPLSLLAKSAGFDDGERWWEYLVEHRQEEHDIFTAIGEAMTVLRESIESDFGIRREEALREAWMRKKLRQAMKDYSGNIAVICGAWHVPALAKRPKVKDDNALLKGLPKESVVATWVPWSFERLAFHSGYGAGVLAPAWYQHLWNTRTIEQDRSEQIAIHWLVETAKALRNQGLDVSSASVIEAVRLANTLASLRGLPILGLLELKEAVLTTFCFGDETPLQLIHDQQVIGRQMGEVPEETPMMPLQQDLSRQQKRLRLKPEASEKVLNLDLRNDTGLLRSELLHRLNLLSIPWGRLHEDTRGKGTFKEVWSIAWDPEFVIRLIEASVHGATIAQAANRTVIQALKNSSHLQQITSTIDRLLLANLPKAIQFAIARLEQEAAIATDAGSLMESLPPLANIYRYGNVRGTNFEVLKHVLDGIVARIGIGLKQSSQSLDEEAARTLTQQITGCDKAIRLLANPEHIELWQATIHHLAHMKAINRLIGGKAFRILLDAKQVESEEAGTRLHYELSSGGDPTDEALWLEGLLDGSGLLLLHDPLLWQIIDAWISRLDQEQFLVLAPLLRRAFAKFEVAERQKMLQKAQHDSQPLAQKATEEPGDFDLERAEEALQAIAPLLGMELS